MALGRLFTTLLGAGIAAIPGLQLAGAAIALGGNIAFGAVDARKARRQAEQNKRQRDLTTTMPTAARRRIYGTDRVPGVLRYWTTHGAENRFLSMVWVFADHPCEAIDEIQFDDRSIGPLDGSGFVQPGSPWYKSSQLAASANIAAVGGTITLPAATTSMPQVSIAGSYVPGYIPAVSTNDSGFVDLTPGGGFTHTVGTTTITLAGALAGIDVPSNMLVVNYTLSTGRPLARVRRYLGAVPQTADATLITDSGGEWTSACRLDGQTYAIITLEWDETTAANGIPVVQALIRGARVFDPRTSTTAWSDNWALCIRDYLRTASGCTDSEIDDASVIEAANKSDELVTVDDGTIKRYTINGSIESTTNPVEALEDMALAGGGMVAWSAGRFRVLAGMYRTPVPLVLTDADLAGGYRYQGEISREDRFNTVIGAFRDARAIDGTRLYTRTDYSAHESAAYIAEDGGAKIERRIDLDYVTDYRAANRIAKQILRRARQGARITALWKLEALPLQVGDVVPVQLNRPGLGFAPRAVTSITQANPGVVTLASHGFTNGTIVTFNVTGMVQLNGAAYLVAGATTNTFTLTTLAGTAVNSTAFGAFTGGTVRSYKPFEVVSARYQFPNAVELVLQETDPSCYDWNFSEVAFLDPAPNTLLPSPTQVAMPVLSVLATATAPATIKTLSDGSQIPYARVSWPARTNAAEYVEIRWKRSFETGYRTVRSRPGDTFLDLEGVSGGDTLQIIGVAVNGIGARSDQWIITSFKVDDRLPRFQGALPALSANLLKNAAFDVSVQEWATYAAGIPASAVTTARTPLPQFRIAGSPSSAYIEIASALTGDGYAGALMSAPFAAQPGQRWCGYASLAPWRSTGFVRLAWFNAADALVQVSSPLNVVPALPGTPWNDPAQYTRAVTFDTVPAGTVYGRLFCYAMNGWTAGSIKQMSIHRPFAGIVPDGSVDVPVWDPGGANVIDTPLIAPEATTLVLSDTLATTRTIRADGQVEPTTLPSVTLPANLDVESGTTLRVHVSLSISTRGGATAGSFQDIGMLFGMNDSLTGVTYPGAAVFDAHFSAARDMNGVTLQGGGAYSWTFTHTRGVERRFALSVLFFVPTGGVDNSRWTTTVLSGSSLTVEVLKR